MARCVKSGSFPIQVTNMLVSTFEILLKPQFPKKLPPVIPPAPTGVEALSRTVIQAYFLTIANVNFFDVTVSLVFTIRFPVDTPPTEEPTSFKDFIDAIDITGVNLTNTQLIPEAVPANNKACLTFTIPANTTSQLILQPDFITRPERLKSANFEARGYVEIFLSSLSGSNMATLLLTPEQRGTFFKDLDAKLEANIGLDQIAYGLPISNGGVFNLDNL